MHLYTGIDGLGLQRSGRIEETHGIVDLPLALSRQGHRGLLPHILSLDRMLEVHGWRPIALHLGFTDLVMVEIGAQRQMWLLTLVGLTEVDQSVHTEDVFLRVEPVR